MPFSTNTKNNEFGHAQVLRDIEHLYMLLSNSPPGGSGDGGVQEDDGNADQDTGDDMARGRALWGNAGGGGGVTNITQVQSTYLLRIIGSGNSTILPYEPVTPTPLAVYDPGTIDAQGIEITAPTPTGAWPDGIGYGDLIKDGEFQARVLIANWAPTTFTQGSFVSGMVFSVYGRRTLTYLGTDMVFYVPSWL